MAFEVRTINEIFTELLTEKQTLTSLDGLVDGGITDENSLIVALDNSQVAEWILWLYNIATQIHLTELRTTSAITDIDDIIAAKNAPVSRWYIDKALEFQLNGNLVIDPITYQIVYDPITVADQIIASCTTVETANVLILKIRRKDTDILTAPELVQFENYMNQIKVAGTQILTVSYAGDLFTLNMQVIYDGTKELTTVQTDVETAINNYLTNLEFDSKFLSSALVDALQSVDGVIDPRFNSSSAEDKDAVVTVFTHEYETIAGWGLVNPATPLSGTITYTPRIL